MSKSGVRPLLRPIVGIILLVCSFALFPRPRITDVPPQVFRLFTKHDTCQPCDGATREICERWGESAILRSRAYEGSRGNLERFLSKVRSGQEVKIGVLGGSISACADSTLEDCYHTVLGRDLADGFAKYGSNVTIVNGAQESAGSDFFASCWPLQLPDPVDLYILEFAVNDVAKPFQNDEINSLLRQLLALPNSPSVLFLNMYSPFATTTGSWVNGGDAVLSLAQYYDIPVISHRNVLYHHRHLHQELDQIVRWFSPGDLNGKMIWEIGHHPSKLGHRLTADLIRAFLLQQICIESHTLLGGSEVIDLPELPSWSPYAGLKQSQSPDEPDKGVCATAAPGQNQLVLRNDSLGFRHGQWKRKHYLVGSEPGDTAMFDIENKRSHIILFYWKSATIGLGMVRCWFDEYKNETTLLDGRWSDPTNVPKSVKIFTRPPRGKKKLSCQIQNETNDPQGRHEFRITAIYA